MFIVSSPSSSSTPPSSSSLPPSSSSIPPSSSSIPPSSSTPSTAAPPSSANDASSSLDAATMIGLRMTKSVDIQKQWEEWDAEEKEEYEENEENEKKAASTVQRRAAGFGRKRQNVGCKRASFDTGLPVLREHKLQPPRRKPAPGVGDLYSCASPSSSSPSSSSPSSPGPSTPSSPTEEENDRLQHQIGRQHQQIAMQKHDIKQYLSDQVDHERSMATLTKANLEMRQDLDSMTSRCSEAYNELEQVRKTMETMYTRSAKCMAKNKRDIEELQDLFTDDADDGAAAASDPAAKRQRRD